MTNEEKIQNLTEEWYESLKKAKHFTKLQATFQDEKDFPFKSEDVNFVLYSSWIYEFEVCLVSFQNTELQCSLYPSTDSVDDIYPRYRQQQRFKKLPRNLEFVSRL